jgi:hypothetical protein
LVSSPKNTSGFSAIKWLRFAAASLTLKSINDTAGTTGMLLMSSPDQAFFHLVPLFGIVFYQADFHFSFAKWIRKIAILMGVLLITLAEQTQSDESLSASNWQLSTVSLIC